MPDMLTIGRLSAATGVKVPTIRFYESVALLPAPPRTASDRRLYDDAAVRRLSFIRHARNLGFPLEAIRALLDLSAHPEQPCDQADEIVAQQLAEVDRKIAQLSALREELARMAHPCRGGRVADCRVIESLAEAPPRGVPV